MTGGSPLFDLARAPRPAVICLGLAAYDVSWTVERLPAGAGKSRAESFQEGGGGMAATAAATVARLGGYAELWARAGQDTFGHAMRQELLALGVDVSQFRLFEGARSSISGVIVDRLAERMIVNFRGAGLPGDPGWLCLEPVERTGAVLADTRWVEGACALFTEARQRGVPTVLDGEVAESSTFDAVLPLTDYAVFSEQGLAGYAAGQRDLESQLRCARAKGCLLAAATLGDQGIAWFDGTQCFRMPSFPVRAVDTTGAGDVFHGALAFAVAAGLEWRKAARFAAAVAALKCEQAGARAGIPDLATTLAFLRQSKEAE